METTGFTSRARVMNAGWAQMRIEGAQSMSITAGQTETEMGRARQLPLSGPVYPLSIHILILLSASPSHIMILSLPRGT